MDAISFVLGVKTGQLRGNNLKDLIHVGAGEAPCFVTLVYTNDDWSKEKDYTELRFQRLIDAKTGASKYKVGNKGISAEEYEKRLLDLNINVKARNFLVFQVRLLVLLSHV